MSTSLRATRADGFYQPVEFDPDKHKTLNKIHGTHRLGSRAKKINQGIIIIRFEMPFDVWCLKCENLIKCGVRFNAEKKKVGKFINNPIFEFKISCKDCKNEILIRTNPEKTDYDCFKGCRRKFISSDLEAKIETNLEKLYQTDLPVTKAIKILPKKNKIIEITDEINKIFQANQKIVDFTGSEFSNDYIINSMLRKKAREKSNFSKRLRKS